MERTRSDFEKMTVQELYNELMEISYSEWWHNEFGSINVRDKYRRERFIAKEVFAEKMQAHGIPWNK